MVARVGLGVFEAGFGPGIPLYMCKYAPERPVVSASAALMIAAFAAFFYTKEEMGMRMAYWFGFAAVAGAFGGLIAFGIQHVHAAVANWKLLFIVEGIPTILIGLLSMLILPNRPEETLMFNERERELALERANRGIKADTGRVVNRGGSTHRSNLFAPQTLSLTYP